MTRRVSPAAGRSLPWQGMDQDRRNAVLLYGAIGVVVAFALLLVGWGYYKDRIAPNHETVLKVGSRGFDVSFLERRIKSDFAAQKSPSSATLKDLVVQTLQEVELEEVVRQAAKRQEIYPSDADIDDAIRKNLGVPADAPRSTFAAFYRRDVLRLGLPVNEYREIIAALLIENRLQRQYREGAPSEGEQVDAQVIRLSAESKALEAKQRLANGEKFNLVALDMSIDPSKEAGGELGWVTRAEVNSKVADALFSLPLGQISDPVQARDGWYVLLARAKEVRPIDDVQKQRIAARTFDNLMSDTRDQVGSTSRLTEDQIVLIGRHVLKGV